MGSRNGLGVLDRNGWRDDLGERRDPVTVYGGGAGPGYEDPIDPAWSEVRSMGTGGTVPEG